MINKLSFGSTFHIVATTPRSEDALLENIRIIEDLGYYSKDHSKNGIKIEKGRTSYTVNVPDKDDWKIGFPVGKLLSHIVPQNEFMNIYKGETIEEAVKNGDYAQYSRGTLVWG